MAAINAAAVASRAERAVCVTQWIASVTRITLT
jgi:hypothetical protein